jgi:DNA-binding SARP family transcriptional activator
LSRLKIRLFGGFQVSWQESRIDSFESQKVRALLAYLAHGHRRSFSRDHLAGLLWPDTSSDSARRNLRQALYSLRRAVSDQAGEAFPALHVAKQTIQLRPESQIWIDTEEFQQRLGATQAGSGGAAFASLAAAVQLYSGDFLEGFHVKGVPAFEEWWLLEQEQLREAAAGALRALVEHHLAEGSYSLGVKYAR